jgi:hypothetical protein
MATKFFSIAQKGMGKRHEMTIRTKGRGKEWEKRGKKGNKNKGKK